MFNKAQNVNRQKFRLFGTVTPNHNRQDMRSKLTCYKALSSLSFQGSLWFYITDFKVVRISIKNGIHLYSI